MTAKQFSLVAALIFAVIAVFQLIRAVVGMSINIGDISVPASVSWGAFVGGTILAWLGYRASRP